MIHDEYSDVNHNNFVDDSPYANIDIKCKYLDEFQYCLEYKNLKNLSFMTFNIQSLQSKFNQFKDMMQNLINNSCAPEIILLQEIWKLHDAVHFDLAGYTFIHKTRTSSQGGGVGIYIKNNIQFSVLEHYSIFIDHIYESLFIELFISKKKKIIIGNVYRPSVNHPVLSNSEQFNSFFELFTNILDKLANLNLQVLIGGDFNLDALKYRINRSVTNYIDLLFSYGFLQLILKPTRCSSRSATLIDHFISNSNDDFHDTVILTSAISDHFPILYISKSKNEKNIPPLVSYRNFSQNNIDNFTNALNQINWDFMYNLNAQHTYDYFSETFLTLFNLYFPVLFKKANRNLQPMNLWM